MDEKDAYGDMGSEGKLEFRPIKMFSLKNKRFELPLLSDIYLFE